MLKEIPATLGIKLDTRLRTAIYEFGKSVNAPTMSDAVRSLLVVGLDRASSIDMSILKAGYRTGINRGLSIVKEGLLKHLNDEMEAVDAASEVGE